MQKKHLNAALAFLIFFVFGFQPLNAQEHGDDHLHEDHELEHIHEIGVSVSPVYFVKAKELSTALHLHYTYNFPETKFGVGLAYEHVFDEHKHNFWGVEASFRPVHPFSISLTPGLTYERNDFSEKQFAMHLETAYEFELSHFHLGPALEFAYHNEDYHVSLGLHIGFGF